MNALALSGTLVAYGTLALLLINLNFLSLWKWWIKAAAIILTAGVFVVAYFSITGMIGWPSKDTLPERFSLLHTRIVEPDKLKGVPGHIYLWVEQVDEHQVVISEPRAFEVPYTETTATDTTSAQNKLDGGEQVLGTYEANKAKTGERQGSPNANSANTSANGEHTEAPRAASPGSGTETITEAAALNFSDMPAVDLPDKGAVVASGQ